MMSESSQVMFHGLIALIFFGSFLIYIINRTCNKGE